MKTMAESSGVYTVDFFGDDVLVAFAGRNYGNKKRGKFLKEIGIAKKDLVLLKQVHSANLVLVRSGGENHYDRTHGDGMLTSDAGIALGVLTADCVPVYFWDPEKRVIAIAHAGWRGTVHGIASKVIHAFRQNFLSKSQSIRIIFGPAIHACCYEVGGEFKEWFHDFYRETLPSPTENAHDARGHVDLTGALKAELLAEGLLEENIHDTGICTACENDRFFSARREEGTEERILSVLSIRGGFSNAGK